MRLSWLVGPNISAVYAKALEKRKPNSVRRSLHRAVTELLAYHLGADARDAAFRDVKVPGEDDTRQVVVSAKQVRALVDACQPDRFRWMVAASILTAADRGPLLALWPEHVDLEAGLLTIPDRKTRSRWRVVRLSAPAQTLFRLALAGIEPGERLFPWTQWQVRKMYDAARERAKLPHVRFKDLRHLLPTALAALGVDRREIEALLGHAPGSSSTRRYITPAGDVGQLDRAAERMGLDKLLRIG